MLYTNKRLQKTKRYNKYNALIDKCYKTSIEKEQKQQNFYDTTTDKKFAMPSKVSDDAKKIYKLMEVPITTKPSISKYLGARY